MRLLHIYISKFGLNDYHHTLNTATQLIYAHLALGEYDAALAVLEEVIEVHAP